MNVFRYTAKVDVKPQLRLLISLKDKHYGRGHTVDKNYCLWNVKDCTLTWCVPGMIDWHFSIYWLTDSFTDFLHKSMTYTSYRDKPGKPKWDKTGMNKVPETLLYPDSLVR